jgi:hypothetical protein
VNTSRQIRAAAGVRNAEIQTDPHWKDFILFYEYFHAGNGTGLGASHQTGWTGLVAGLIDLFGRPNHEIPSRTPAGRWGQSEEIAGTAVYLASRASDLVTGTTIRVDGGYSIR